MHTDPNPRRYAGQRGTVLIVSLLILLVMTVLGITAMQTNLLEEKMAGNYRDVNLAFQAAEAALRDAEDDIDGTRFVGLTGFNADCTDGLCDARSQTNGLRDVWDVDDFPTQEANGVVIGDYTSMGSLALVACPPRYWIEGFRIRPAGSTSWKTRYRVTSLSCGGSATTEVVLQSVYAPR